MGAAWMVGRSELRRHLGSVVLLAGVVALVVAVVLALAAGARRTSSVVERFAEVTDARDFTITRDSARVTADASLLDPWRERIEAMDGVERTGLSRIALAFADAEIDTDFFVIASPDGSTGYEFDRMLILEGRMPARDSVDGVAINEAAADAMDLELGDTITVEALSRDDATSLLAEEMNFIDVEPIPVELRVVGIGRTGEELSGSSIESPVAFASPAFWAAKADRLGWVGALVSVTTDGTVSVGDLEEAAQGGLESNEFVGVSDARDEWRREADEGAQVIAITMWALAGVTLAAGLLGIAQVVTRQAGLASGSVRAADALGMSRRDRTLAAAVPAAVAVTAGTVVGAVVAVTVSGAFPVSVARWAEPDPGARFDPLAIVGGGFALVGSLLALVWSAGRRAGRDARERVRTRRSMASRVSSVIQRPAPRVGVRMALDGQVGTRGVPVRSALVGAGVAAAALIGAAVFVSSTTEAIDDPAAYGWVWDTKPEIISNDDPIAMVTDIISSDEIVAAGDARCGQLEVDGLIRTACALTPVKGSMQLRVADGRPPAGPSEVALGSRVLDDLGVGIGDRVTLTGVEGSDFETIVVGQAVGPLTDARIPGETLHVSPELFAALLPADVVGEFTGRFVPFRYADGVDAAGFEDELERSYALDFTSDSYAEPPSLLSLLDEMRWLFVASAAFLGVIGAVGLTHFLVVSVRRRRPDFGVLRAMGLRRPDVRHAVSWQAAAATGVGVAIGAPLGVVLGRSAWQIVVADLGLAAEPTSAGWAVVGVVLVSVAGAAVLAIGPGWLAARPSPAESLRSE